MTSDASRPPKLDWWRFIVAATIVILTVGFVTVYKIDVKRNVAMAVAMGAFAVSTIGYAAVRWHGLRSDLASGRLTPQGFWADPQRHFLGPMRSLAIWVSCTVTAFVAVIVLFG